MKYHFSQSKYHLQEAEVMGKSYFCFFTYRNYGDINVLKKKTYPGYLYMLDNGGTTTWEHWNGARSRIHNCYNGVGQWFYQSIGGIRQIDGKVAYSEFLVDPQIPAGITWAKTRINTPRGWISVHWEILDRRMKMDVEVPVGSIAKVKCPDGLVELQSGKHSIEYPL